jgi:hypothetical protein
MDDRYHSADFSPRQYNPQAVLEQQHWMQLPPGWQRVCDVAGACFASFCLVNEPSCTFSDRLFRRKDLFFQQSNRRFTMESANCLVFYEHNNQYDLERRGGCPNE